MGNLRHEPQHRRAARIAVDKGEATAWALGLRLRRLALGIEEGK